MENKLSNPNQTVFEQIKETDENGNEFWGARKLSKILEYTDFRNFLTVINKAKVACKNSGQPVENYLVDFNGMVSIGSGTERINKMIEPGIPKNLTVLFLCRFDSIKQNLSKI